MKSPKFLTIVSMHKNTLVSFEKEITGMFQDNVKIKLYCFEDETVYEGIDGDVILISNYKVFEQARRYIKNENATVIIARRTLSEQGIKKIKNLQKGTNAILYNVTLEMAIETISTIYQLGIRQINLIPAHKDMNPLPNVDLVITPGEQLETTVDVEKIDIGSRILDLSTYMDILAKMDINYPILEEKVKLHFANIVPISYGLDKILDKKDQLASQLDLFLQIIPNGIIAIDSSGIVTIFNDKAANLVHKKPSNVIGYYYETVFPDLKFPKVLSGEIENLEELMNFGQTSIVVTINSLKIGNEITGAVARLVPFQETEKRQHRLRSQLLGKGFVPKYHFFHIIGDSSSIKKQKKIAQRMATSDASILINGESGTGKELFAQAIHNYSPRSQYAFVAFNCAALPEQLLESELFGYVEGAFTGARKGGKPGLFEHGHLGTVFLDEIGEMPKVLQARLLRVLQEKEVMRVGGDSIIPVNIRIIAATNRDLKLEVAQGKFREDLYYRLNVLPISIPPLRERTEDIIPLFSYFIQDHDITLTEEARHYVESYPWPGNIRELENCANYLINYGKRIVEPIDLPIFKETTVAQADNVSSYHKIEQEFTYNEMLILDILYQSFLVKKRVGRKRIAELAYKRETFLSEQQLRGYLTSMKERGLVEISQGRGGTTITQNGIRTFLEMNK
ncbi:sigma 54-interacting transcriptional regulator [Halalkalibacter alkalisediminis]|uniref:Sigma 54-interacting transcriptional regulator n=1 Tax=Halalkalibacter alkalisediminis TaxID=935616 RepID=A0ABV6NP56_9BACI|nr:sigma 54-interacting transcriptional regulator [Halalkalibacter alkalisediminis]